MNGIFHLQGVVELDFVSGQRNARDAKEIGSSMLRHGYEIRVKWIIIRQDIVNYLQFDSAAWAVRGGT